MQRLSLKSDLNNCNVYGDLFTLDRGNILLHDELVKAAGCSEWPINLYQNEYCFIAK